MKNLNSQSESDNNQTLNHSNDGSVTNNDNKITNNNTHTNKSQQKKPKKLWLWIYAIALFLTSIYIFQLNIDIQQAPNFNYKLVENGHWQVTDDTHPTMKKDTVITKIVINGETHELDNTWIARESFVMFSKPKQTLGHEGLVYDSSHSQDDKLKTSSDSISPPIQLVDASGTTHSFTLRPYRISDIQSYSWYYYVLGWLFLTIGVFTVQFGKFNKAKLLFLLTNTAIGLGCFIEIAALKRVWAIDPDLIVERLFMGSTLTRFNLISFFFIWLLVPKNLLARLTYTKIIGLIYIAFFAATWWLGYMIPEYSESKQGFAFRVLPLFMAVLINYFALFLQWYFIHQKSSMNSVQDCATAAANFGKKDAFSISQSIAVKLIIILLVMFASIEFTFQVMVIKGYFDSKIAIFAHYVLMFLYSLGTAVLILNKYLYRVADKWWYFAGIFIAFSVFLTSVLLLSATSLHLSMPNILFSLIIAFMAYLTTVYYCKVRYSRTESKMLTIAMPKLISINNRNLTKEGINDIWQDIVQNVFQPRHLRIISKESALAIIAKDETFSIKGSDTTDILCIDNAGETLLIEAIDNKVFVLDYANNGSRLFTKDSMNKAGLLWSMLQQAYHLTIAYGKGEAAERKRIALDLHDDIGSKLLHLSFQAGDYGDYAKQTLEDLRTLTHALNSESTNLHELLANIRYQSYQSCENSDIELDFTTENINFSGEMLKVKEVAAQSVVNIRCIFNELLRNAIQHDNTKNISIHLALATDCVTLVVKNDGDITDLTEWKKGLGTVSTERRAEQLGGKVVWITNPAGGVNCHLTMKASNIFEYE